MLWASYLVLAQSAAAEPSFPVKPPIVLRSTWSAKPVGPGAIRHTIQHITIHHTGVAQSPFRSLESKLMGLQLFSQRVDKLADGRTKPAWPDIPYHYYISYDGRIGEGRPVWYAGDTNTEYDPTGHLLIVVEGDFTYEWPNSNQLSSLEKLTAWCAWHYKIPPKEIQGHGDYAKTDCPGKNLIPELAKLRAIVEQNQGSSTPQ